jgi:hypothetical protein
MLESHKSDNMQLEVRKYIENVMLCVKITSKKKEKRHKYCINNKLVFSLHT